MVSIGLVPVSFALVGPVTLAAGPQLTLVGAAVVAALPFIAFLFVSGVRDPERSLPERARSPGDSR